MSSSSYGVLFFGAKLQQDEETFEFPWAADEFGGDEEAWWRFVAGFKPTVESPFDDEGEYKPGFHRDHQTVDAYYDERSAWMKANPMPFEIERLGYYDEPGYALVAEGSVQRAEWDECLQLTIEGMPDRPSERESMIAFCKKYGLSLSSEIGWFMSSYYG